MLPSLTAKDGGYAFSAVLSRNSAGGSTLVSTAAAASATSNVGQVPHYSFECVAFHRPPPSTTVDGLHAHACNCVTVTCSCSNIVTVEDIGTRGSYVITLPTVGGRTQGDVVKLGCVRFRMPRCRTPSPFLPNHRHASCAGVCCLTVSDPTHVQGAV